jgi:uncharacterized protein
MSRTLIWSGLDSWRAEIARVEVTGDELNATGTQVGIAYELRYALAPGRIGLEVVGGERREVELGEADFFDLEFSPLLNTLPVLRDGLLSAGPPRDYVMAFVAVPSLDVTFAEQRYEPIGDRLVRFRSGDFTADLKFDDDGFVVHYPGLALREYPAPR